MKRILLVMIPIAALLLSLIVVVAADPGADPSLTSSDPLLWLMKAYRRIVARDQADWARATAASDPEPVSAASPSTGYIKGVYFSRDALTSSVLLEHIKTLLETTELNAIVIDVKGDHGHLAYTSTVDAEQGTGANRRHAMSDEAWDEFMAWLKEHGIYTIGRIVVFKDELMAVARPDWAVTDSVTGGIWRDGENLGWGDPSLDVVHDYNVALAVEAAGKGFDEIQFDYVRFPSDGYVGRARIAMANTEENRVEAIASFLRKTHQALQPYDVKLSADVFGYVAWLSNDLGIGQYLEAMAPHLDVLSPMLYPSTFAMGLPGLSTAYLQAIDYPYEVVYEPTRRAVERATAVNPAIEIRPWIQDFRDYAFDRRHYTGAEIRLQMDGAREGGGRGWLLWDPAVLYTPAALVSAQPAYPPNVDGRVLVLEYHRIGEPEDRWQRTPDNFRADLEQLLAAGYYPVNLRDLVEGQLRMVPEGKRPVVLTFDDSTIGQYRILDNGAIDPDSAVGILKAFHDAHEADWPLRATFFVLQGEGQPGNALFGQPSLAKQKLATLVGWGMEVGGHTLSHANLFQLSSEEVQRELGLSQAQLQEWLPGYRVVSLSVPYGLFPKDVSLVAAGEHNGVAYSYKAVVLVGAHPALSPLSPDFDPYRIPRVQATQSELDYWLPFLDKPGVACVSAGE